MYRAAISVTGLRALRSASSAWLTKPPDLIIMRELRPHPYIVISEQLQPIDSSSIQRVRCAPNGQMWELMIRNVVFV
jgi:hypothetical protein